MAAPSPRSSPPPGPVPSPQPNVGTVGAGGFLREFSPGFWPAAAAVAVGTGLVSGGLMKLLTAVQHLAYAYRQGSFVDAVARASDLRRVGVMLAAGMLAGLVGWAVRRAPVGQAGELTTALWFRAGHLSPVVVTVRALLSIVIVGMGAALGREAAPKQMGALLASALGERARLRPTERRLLVACGAGAGMACVYNVPLGGALFALEVLLGALSLPLAVPALLVSGLATLVSWSLLDPRPTYVLGPIRDSPALIAWSALAGPLAGLASVAYTRSIVWADRRRPAGAARITAPVAAFGAVGALAIAFPVLLGNGKDVVELAFRGRLAVGLVLALLVLRPLATALCLSSGAPGGLFTPTLTFGSLCGAALGAAWSACLPGIAPGACALVGAAAVMAAATLGPISAVVLVLELTGSATTLLMPVLLAAGGATLVARACDARSIYSGRIHAEGVPAPAAGAPEAIALSSAATLPRILERVLARGGARRAEVYDDRAAHVGGFALDDGLAARAVAEIGAAAAIATAADLARPVPSA